MRFIPTKVHGYIDYLTAIALLIAPWMLSRDRDGAEVWVPVILGAATIIYSLLTNYEMGASRKLSMKAHLTIDLLSGALLAVSPWLFDFHEYSSTPYVIVGIFEIAVSLMTRTHSSIETQGRTQSTHRTATTA